jgi:hypothetical protein
MAAIHRLRLGNGRFATAIAFSYLTFAATTWAQDGAAPAASAGPGTSPAVVPAPMAVPGTTYVTGPDWAPTGGRMGLFETARESLFGDASTGWRPLSLGTFFSEGWDEPWAGGPAGQSGLTPRHGWLGAFEGVFYRLALVNGTYQNGLNKPFGGNGYGGNFTTFLPFSRRFELFVNVPFIAANGTEDPTRGYRSDFGDVSLAGSFLLSESEAFTQLFTLGVILPTGEAATGGNQRVVNPRYSFWSNPCDAWVVRGGTGVSIPVSNSTAQTTGNAALAVGRYFTPHDVPFGDLVFYVNCAATVPLEGNGAANVGIGPGTRFQIAKNTWFLNYWEYQVGDAKPFDYQVQFAIVRAW